MSIDGNPPVWGATSVRLTVAVPSPGLSPCIRGYHSDVDDVLDPDGSIPVHTGPPRSSPLARPCRGGYPREYGATRPRPQPPECISGLSPCIRGYLSACSCSEEDEGSILVHTGLPCGRCPGRPGPQVYPRAYGATLSDQERTWADWGLSPCVRGYRHGEPRRRGHTGSIPACARLPSVPSRHPALLRVYPRVYRATAFRYLGQEWSLGPSSCIRGYRVSAYAAQVGPGSISVHTGPQ